MISHNAVVICGSQTKQCPIIWIDWKRQLLGIRHALTRKHRLYPAPSKCQSHFEGFLWVSPRVKICDSDLCHLHSIHKGIVFFFFFFLEISYIHATTSMYFTNECILYIILSIVTPVFSVTRSFSNHSEMLHLLLNKHSFLLSMLTWWYDYFNTKENFFLFCSSSNSSSSSSIISIMYYYACLYSHIWSIYCILDEYKLGQKWSSHTDVASSPVCFESHVITHKAVIVDYI